jgi:hypothetical protein
LNELQIGKTTRWRGQDAVYPAHRRIPRMGDFYIGGASVKLLLPIFEMNFPEIVDSDSEEIAF